MPFGPTLIRRRRDAPCNVLEMSHFGVAARPSANSAGHLTVNVADAGGADVPCGVGPMSKWDRPAVTCHISPADAGVTVCADGPVGLNAYLD